MIVVVVEVVVVVVVLAVVSAKYCYYCYYYSYYYYYFGNYYNYHSGQKGGLSWGVSKNTHADFSEFCKNPREFCKIHENPRECFCFFPQVEAKKTGRCGDNKAYTTAFVEDWG